MGLAHITNIKTGISGSSLKCIWKQRSSDPLPPSWVTFKLLRKLILGVLPYFHQAITNMRKTGPWLMWQAHNNSMLANVWCSMPSVKNWSHSLQYLICITNSFTGPILSLFAPKNPADLQEGGGRWPQNTCVSCTKGDRISLKLT